MKECSKSIQRRLHDPNFVTRYFRGDGLDIGGKPDPLALYLELFPLMKSVRTWDLEDGDAQILRDIEDGSCDFVHSSHCLEHLRDPEDALHNWFRVLRTGAHLVVTVPDEDLYEQGVFPSTFNRDHKWTFTIHKKNSWSPKSVNLIDIALALGPQAEIVKLELLNATYRYRLPRYDQTLTPVGECGIEMVLRKRSQMEMTLGEQPRRREPTDGQLRVYLNQYRNDIETLKRANQERKPFTDDSEIS